MKKFWSQGTPLGSVGSLSWQDMHLGACRFQFLVIWGLNKHPMTVACQGQAKNPKTAGAWCDTLLELKLRKKKLTAISGGRLQSPSRGLRTFWLRAPSLSFSCFQRKYSSVKAINRSLLFYNIIRNVYIKHTIYCVRRAFLFRVLQFCINFAWVLTLHSFSSFSYGADCVHCCAGGKL